MSIGTGWASFVRSHSLSIGDFLTFEVIDEASLVVYIHRRTCSPLTPAATNAGPSKKRLTQLHLPEVANTRRRLSPQLVNRERPVPVKVLPAEKPPIPDFTDAGRPQFRKTLRKIHLKNFNLARLVIIYPPSHVLLSVAHHVSNLCTLLWESL